jgi:hypothetical protein
VEVVIQPKPDWGIAEKREWIMREWLRRGRDKIIMLDDDLQFATRKQEGSTELVAISGDALVPEFDTIEAKLGPEFPHVGFGQRLYNNQQEAGWKTPGRMIYALGYYLPIVVRECEFNRVPTHEDMDLTLQLLRKGYPNAIWNTTVVNQRRYNAPGGVTDERTVESSDADAERLRELHPGYVTIRERAYKSSVPRKEVICQWEQALKDGRESRAMGRNARPGKPNGGPGD